MNEKISRIQAEDLEQIKEKLEKLLSEFPVEHRVRGHLEQLKEWIEAGKNIKEIVEFLKQSWAVLGPIVTNILLNQ